MNDFTKIDLKKLYNILNDMMNGKFYPKSDLHIPKLMDIVRFKIDYYCEHEEETKDLAYWERNMLALLLGAVTANAGWYNHGEHKGWSRVISLYDGKITFHVHDNFNLGDLEEIKPNWDGHTTNEKWKYVAQLTGVKFDK